MPIPLASRSSSGLGHRPFTAATRVRIPYGMPSADVKISGLRVAFFMRYIIQSARSYSQQRHAPVA